MGIWKTVTDFARDVRNATEGAGRPERVGASDPYRLPGGAATDRSSTNLPMSLFALVRSSRADLAGLIWSHLRAGRSPVRIGIGDEVDAQLLDDDLLAAHVQRWSNQIIATVRWAPEGYILGREYNSFGVFWATKAFPGSWFSVRRNSFVRGLRPGDIVSLGSCPGEGIAFRLPVPPDGCPADDPVEASSWRFENKLRIAVTHWRYPRITISADPDAVVPIEDPHHADVDLVLDRDPNEPRKGFDLLVREDGGALSYAEPGVFVFHPLTAGTLLHLDGVGHRLKLGPYEVVIPAPINPTPRFADRAVPTVQDILEVLDLEAHELSDPKAVRSRYRELARRFHPDRSAGNPGHTSRFVEIQACWSAYQDQASELSDP